MKKKPSSKKYLTLNSIFVDLAEMLQPPEQISVSQAAEKYRKLNNPGSYTGDWKNSMVPPMVEPMDMMISRNHEGVIFVAPAQTGKTDSLVVNTLVYHIKVNPMDVMLVCPTQIDARDFSFRRIDRLHRHSTEIGEMLMPGSSGDNVYDKHYRNGMLFTLGWPTASQLAGKPIPIMLITDRDRMDDDVEGDGEPYDLSAKRTTTFGSYAMTMAESSPSKPITDLKYICKGHEAPPSEGILKLYNRGDRRRWHWPCPFCNQYFEGNFTDLEWDNDMIGTNHEKASTVRMVCPHCKERIAPDYREEMQSWGIWLKDGQKINSKGIVTGPEPKTRIASFWLNGVAAAFTSWRKLVSVYLDAYDEFNRTGSEEALRKFYNTDLGEPYYPQSFSEDDRKPEVIRSRADKLLGQHLVPPGTNFLIATIDTQTNKWVVQVFAIRGGERFDMIVIDRFDIKYSARLNENDERHWVKPHKELEDWDQITEQVIKKRYVLDEPDRVGPRRTMGIWYTTCDSGGRKGVATMAYNYYRRLRAQNMHRNFMLLRGDHGLNLPRTRIGYPDSNQKGMLAGARGDIPVLFLNSNQLKDDLNSRLGCLTPGMGMFLTPTWLPDNFYTELCAEIRTPKGWENPNDARNESTDLSYYCIGVCVSEIISIERIDWAKPPAWASADWDVNLSVAVDEEDGRFAPNLQSRYDFAAAGKALA
ncbi:Phage terminase large subunit [compost metagenome]